MSVVTIMATTAPTQNSVDVSFTTVAEQYVKSIRAGKPPTIDSMVERFPQHAKEIRMEFPTILMAEQLHRRVKKDAESQKAIPAKIGNYRVTAEIGRGGMGRVFAGYHQTMKRAVAIKILSIASVDRADAIKRFQREAQAAGQLNHPNIVQIFDYGTQDDFLYIVMQRIRGLDLAKVIAGLTEEKVKSGNKQLAMDWRMIAQIGTQVASAIGHAHDKGLIHRDIKPANLMMEANGHAWITDFGLVKVSQCDTSLSRTGDLIGTPRYMAPEQLRGVSDSRSDIYGLGISLYELATGQRAWDELTGQEIITKRSTLELPHVRDVNPTVPAALCDIIMKCCSFKPDDRYQSASELHYVLSRYTHGQRLGDRRKTRNSERSILNRKPIRIARGVATLVGIGLFGWALSIAMRKPSPYKDPVAALNILQDENVRAEFVKELPSIIEEVVTNNDPKFRNAVGSLAEDAILKTVEESEIPEEQKSKIKGQVNEMLTSYKEGRNPIQRPAKEWQEMQMQASLAMRFGEVFMLIRNSKLGENEKSTGQQWLVLLQQGIGENRLSQQTIGRLVDFQSQYLSDPNRLSDENLRKFVSMVEEEVTAVGGRLAPVTHKDIQNIQRAVEATLNHPGLNQILHEMHMQHSVRAPRK